MHGRHRPVVAVLGGAALLLLATLGAAGAAAALPGGGAPASCAGAPPADLAALQIAIDDATATGDHVRLGTGADLDGSTSLELPVGHAIAIDLCGGRLAIAVAPGDSAAAVHVPAGASLVIEDSVGGGVLDVTGGGDGAGIGGDGGESGGAVTIEAGTVTATGGDSGGFSGGAGIGGGDEGDGGTLVIHGGTVTATGGSYAAGLGGGYRGGGGTIVVDGGTVTGIGSFAGVAMGGGYGGGGGAVTIGGGTVITRGDPSHAYIGGGAFGTPGTLTVRGTALPGSAALPAPGTGSSSSKPSPVTPDPTDPSRYRYTEDASQTAFTYVTSLSATPSAEAATVGDTITVTATGRSLAGDVLVDAPADIVLSSSVPEDIVNGDSVTFRHASTHVITAAYAGLAATFAVEVSPALAATGAEPTPWLASAAALVCLGAVLSLRAARRRPS